jgi:hypothetical protein
MRTAAILLGLLVAAGVPAASQDEESKTLRSKLRSIRLDVDFSNYSLVQLVDYLREVADINIVLNPKAEVPAPLAMRARGVTIQSLLRLLLKPHQIGYTIEGGVVIIAPESALKSQVRLEIIDVRDLLMPIRDFPGIEITLDADAAGATFAAAPDDAPAEFPIVDLLKAHTGGKSWEENPRASLQLMNGLLFVRNTDEVIQQIRAVLAGLRRFK